MNPTTFLALVACALLGWLAGRLISYLADMLPGERRLLAPTCPACGMRQPWLPHLLWPSACPACGHRPSRRAWLAALFYTFSTPILFYYPLPGLGFWLSLLVLTYLGLVWIIDVEHRLVLHATSLAGALICLLAGWQRQGLADTLIGGLVGFALMLGLYLLGIGFARLLAARRGAQISAAAMGFGDVLLGAITGLLVGWPAVLTSFVATILAAGLFSLGYLLYLLARRQYHLGAAFPYAPFIILGTLYALLP